MSSLPPSSDFGATSCPLPMRDSDCGLWNGERARPRSADCPNPQRVTSQTRLNESHAVRFGAAAASWDNSRPVEKWFTTSLNPAFSPSAFAALRRDKREKENRSPSAWKFARLDLPDAHPLNQNRPPAISSSRGRG
jgi:hypothetical protein